jgi:hypothetical protein
MGPVLPETTAWPGIVVFFFDLEQFKTGGLQQTPKSFDGEVIDMIRNIHVPVITGQFGLAAPEVRNFDDE